MRKISLIFDTDGQPARELNKPRKYYTGGTVGVVRKNLIAGYDAAAGKVSGSTTPHRH